MMGITETVSTFIINLIDNLGYFGIYIGMTLEAACIPIPSEIIMTFAGFVVYQGKLSLIGITLVGAVGDLTGSLIAYYVGKKGGRPLLEKYGKYILITKSKLDLAHDWFERYGHEAVFFGRMLPIIRTFISLPAGISGMNIKKFIIYSFSGSLIWTFALGYIGVQLGHEWDIIRQYFYILDIIVIIGIIGLFAYLIYNYFKK
jgi:membrane protein DedA with SNARE-associated domain